MPDLILIERNGGVADVRLNRPDKRNALNIDMFKALIETADRLSQDPSLRCVVLSGQGQSFCAGLDLTIFNQAESEDSENFDLMAVEDGRLAHNAQQAVYGWLTMPVPVIASIQGHALGAGIQLALAADIRFVTEDALLSVLEIRWGLAPDMTGTQTLINLIGLDLAKELAFTGRMVSGTEAVAKGLCSHLSGDPHRAALDLAAEIASKPPEAIRAIKRLFDNAPKVSTTQGLINERTEISQLIGTPNQIEQVSAFFEKRKPEFQNPA